MTLVNGRIVRPDGMLARSLRIAGGRIVSLDEPPRSPDCVIDLDEAFVFPGLINAHDHLELNHFPRLKWRDRYASAREWIADFQPRFERDPVVAAGLRHPLADRLLVGGLKNLLSGVTTVCHHNPLYRELRPSRLSLPASAGRSFPVRVVGRYGFSHSLHVDGDKVRWSFLSTRREHPWIIHAAEGTDGEAASEAAVLQHFGCVASNTLVVHGVGLTEADRDSLLSRGAGLIWCPGSNQFLFGRTARVEAFSKHHRLALGTDSRLSGERDLLEELKVARASGQLDSRALFRAVTTDARALLRLPRGGRLQVDEPADLIVLRSAIADPFDALVSASRADILLTMVGGRPKVGDLSFQTLFETLVPRASPARLDGSPRLIDERLAARLRRSPLQEPGFSVDGCHPRR